MRCNIRLVLALAAALCSCKAGEDYHPPTAALPGGWHGMAGAPEARAQDVSEAPDIQGWRTFNDPALEALIAAAQRNNRDVKIAAVRVKEARAMRVAAAAPLYPQVNAKIDGSRGNEENFFNNKPFSLYEAAFDASWEVDLFGATARRAEAAEADIAAREAEARNALITLRAEVARDYIDLRKLQMQYAIAGNAAEAEGKTRGLIRSLAKSGLATGLDAAAAEAQYQAITSRMPALAAALEADKQQLAVLVGKEWEALAPELESPAGIPAAPVSVAVDAPAAVIVRRPDVAQAERQLASAAALKAAAIADFYPRISLSAALGLRYSSLAGGGADKSWSGGGSLLGPIFDAGRLRALVNAADARQEQALLAYEKTVLQAQGEVETNLSAYLNADVQARALDASERANERSVFLATARYAQGLSNYLDVLTAQQALYSSQTALAEAQANAAVAQVRLWKSLGF